MTDKFCAWEYQNNDEWDDEQYYWFSECGHDVQFSEQKFDDRFNFCPFCGNKIIIEE